MAQDAYRVLVVDDNATNRSLLQYHVSAWNMNHDSAVDGSSAAFLFLPLDHERASPTAAELPSGGTIG